MAVDEAVAGNWLAKLKPRKGVSAYVSLTRAVRWSAHEIDTLLLGSATSLGQRDQVHAAFPACIKGPVPPRRIVRKIRERRLLARTDGPPAVEESARGVL